MYAILSKDRMQLFLVKEEQEGAIANLADDASLKDWLKQLRALGVPQDALDFTHLKLLHEAQEKPFGEHLIVEGKAPQDEGTKVELNFELMKTPATDDNSKADYYSLGYGVDVTAGQLLARQEVQGPGKDGYNAIGTRLPFKVNEKTSPLLYNSNVYIEKENKVTEFYSKINGVLLNHTADSLDVFHDFKVRGSVGFKTGNINIGADVVVEGDVKAGFSIRSKGNITVKGVVEKNAILEADKNIVIEGGVNPSTVIRAGHDIQLKFGQGACFEAGGDILAHSYLYDCEAYALGTFKCLGAGSDSRGAVIGGLLNGVKSIELSSVGSQNALTTLVTGFNYKIKQEYLKLKKQKQTLEGEVKRLVRNLPIDLLDPNFKTLTRSLPEMEKKQCHQKITQILTNRRECEILGARIHQLEPDALTQILESSIQIKKALFPDVKIVLCEQYNVVQEEYGSITFSLNNEKTKS